MPQLEHLNLEGNRVEGKSEGFEGNLPASWSTTRQALQVLRLSGNGLSGTLPQGQPLMESKSCAHVLDHTTFCQAAHCWVFNKLLFRD